MQLQLHAAPQQRRALEGQEQAAWLHQRQRRAHHRLPRVRLCWELAGQQDALKAWGALGAQLHEVGMQDGQLRQQGLQLGLLGAQLRQGLLRTACSLFVGVPALALRASLGLGKLGQLLCLGGGQQGHWVADATAQHQAAGGVAQ
jgi:hypothetical protein